MLPPWLAHDEAPGPYITIPQYRFNKTKQHTRIVSRAKARKFGDMAAVERMQEDHSSHLALIDDHRRSLLVVAWKESDLCLALILDGTCARVHV